MTPAFPKELLPSFGSLACKFRFLGFHAFVLSFTAGTEPEALLNRRPLAAELKNSFASFDTSNDTLLRVECLANNEPAAESIVAGFVVRGRYDRIPTSY
jgi:hypothetical protein